MGVVFVSSCNKTITAGPEEGHFFHEIKGEIPESDAEKLQTVGQVVDYIKAKAGQDFVESASHEKGHNGKLVPTMGKFAKYKDLTEAFEEHAKLIATSPIYKKAMARTWDTTLFTKELSKKYATDPRYAQKLLAFIHQDGAGRG